MRKAFFLSLSILVLLSVCKIPPFNEQISQAFLLTTKMSEEAKVGPVEIDGEGLGSLELIRYIPRKRIFDSGFVVKNQQKIEIGYIEENRFFKVSSEPGVLDFDNGVSYQKNYVAETIAETGPYLALVNIQPSLQPPGPPAVWHLNIFEFDHQLPLSIDPDGDPYGTNLDWKIEFDLPITITAIAGVHIAPDPDPLADSIYFLAQKDGAPTTFYEVRFDLKSYDPGIIAGVEVRPAFPATLVDVPLNTFYFHYPFEGVNGTSVAQYRFDGSWKILRWDDTSAGSPFPINLSKQIDALLTTGLLLCHEDEMLFVYDLKGELVHEINLGDLRFVYEWWDGDEFRMVFVLPYYVDYGGERGYMFKVYSLPTVDLSDLEN